MADTPFAPGVFTDGSDGPRLVGGRCTDCGSVTFPAPPSCARCGAVAVEQHPLARRGTLWTFTTQGFLPKEPYAGGETPETFQPYGVGLVELGGEVRVEARLTTADIDRLAIGMEMELVLVPFGGALSYAFAPVEGA
ncbi:Zn-ribbon domain-containing OB-fold protein [Skermania piniformis]|uniref:OB-fold domain-containing protein n=1 Tax=Skermania pinensis TaxID=39122 RepID=A0ABX8S860_9ACTN|nr:OB-fold domain-containing protein [Skermania piniformis]QXQ14049.1 OB-fold domain-containing protein [Skermania piniformis]